MYGAGVEVCKRVGVMVVRGLYIRGRTRPLYRGRTRPLYKGGKGGSSCGTSSLSSLLYIGPPKLSHCRSQNPSQRPPLYGIDNDAYQ